MNRIRLFLSAVALLILSGAEARAQGQAAPPDKLEYNRDIRPILADTCFKCHGPDSAARQAELRLDQRDVALDMGAIAPGKPDESELVRRVLSTDPDEVMPPPETKKELSARQKELLQRWVAEGAEYQPHWSLIAPVRPAVPEVKLAGWVRNPIDNFILARLEKMKLSPAAEADRRTLARRVCLDLTGLPPTPEQVAAFVNDSSPDAYEQYVDRLLKAEQWGEHRGRYWLDYARYADTHGIHFDNYREMWSYRDWVISAFNHNMPYDEFTIVSLAGDLLEGATLDQIVGSGFNRCHMTTNEGGIIDEEYLVLYTRDRTDTVSQVWLGTTAGCAVCHDHKFDPLSQREFYELSAFFNNTTQGARDGNVKDTPPIVPVPLAEDRARFAALELEIPAAKQRVEARRQSARPEYDQWLATAGAEEMVTTISQEALVLSAPLNEGSGETTHVALGAEQREVALAKSATWVDGQAGRALQPQGAACELADFGDFERDQAFTCAAWVKLPANDGYGALCARMDNGDNYRGWDFWLQRRQIGTHIINSWSDNGLKVVGKAQVPANEWTHVAVTYDGSSKAAGVKVYYNGQLQETLVENDKLNGTIKTEVPFKIGQRSSNEPLSGVGMNDLRIYARALPPAEVEALAKTSQFAAVLAKQPEERTDAEKNGLYSWWLGTRDETFQSLTADVAKLEAEQNAIQSRGTIAHVMHEKDEAAMAYILFRGEYDKRRDPVTPETPEALPPFPDNLPRNRLGLAKWLLLPEHPLTARVTVNRFWQEVFGMGIVRTTGDFGVMGELPSHPELLDWLAVDFRESGWDVKRLFRMMVTSAAYRQSAETTPGKLEKDRDNRLLSRGPRFRMDAEMVRDYALSASGLLSGRIGGPSVKPYQPEGVWEAIAMNVSNTRAYQRDSGESLYRRSMYWFWKRMAPPASMDIFNAPNREFCVVRRERTDTPLQALVTLNDEQFVEAAKFLAQRALKEGGDTFDARIDFIAQRLMSRSFRPEELEIVQASLADLSAYYEGHPDDAAKLLGVGEKPADPVMNVPELAAWTMLTNEVMNLDEVLNK
jgi:cytochrome c553